MKAEYAAHAARARRIAAGAFLLATGLIALAIALFFRAIDLGGLIEPWSPLIAGSVAIVVALNGAYWAWAAPRIPRLKPAARRSGVIRRVVVLAIVSPALVVVLVAGELAAMLGWWLYEA